MAKKTIILSTLLLCLLFLRSGYVHAELVVHWTFDDGTAQDKAAAGVTLNGIIPGGSYTPTYLSTGGINGSGAFRFDGSDDFLTPSFVYDMGNGDWSVSFWIKTSDTSTYYGYEGTPAVSVIGDTTNAVGFGVGIEGGKATLTHFYSGWRTISGSTNVANNIGHYLTFIHHSVGKVDIYVDGNAEILGAASYDGQYAYVIRDIGRSYDPKYANMTLDDFRIYNHALSSTEVSQFVVGVPEPTSLIALLMALCFFYLGRKNTK